MLYKLGKKMSNFKLCITGVANLRLFEGLFVALDKSKYPEEKRTSVNHFIPL